MTLDKIRTPFLPSTPMASNIRPCRASARVILCVHVVRTDGLHQVTAEISRLSQCQPDHVQDSQPKDQGCLRIEPSAELGDC